MEYPQTENRGSFDYISAKLSIESLMQVLNFKANYVEPFGKNRKNYVPYFCIN